jgi:ATP-dependent helicase/nuclease subunit A
MTPNWTPAQRRAIDLRGRDVAVSAGAGAGKTAVLTARVVAQLSDPGRPRRIDELLIVTFTRAAAEEMRTRIARRLEERIAAEDLPAAMQRHMEEQLALLPRARISTIHSACLDIATVHAGALGLPPGVEVMDEAEARLETEDALRRYIEDSLAGSIGEDVRHAMEGLDILGTVEPFLGLLTRHVASLEALPDPEAYCARALAPWEEAASAGDRWPATRIGELVFAQVRARLAEATAIADDVAAAARTAGPLTDSGREFLNCMLALRDAAAQATSLPAFLALGACWAPFGATTVRSRKCGLQPISAEVRGPLREALAALDAIASLTPAEWVARRAAAARLLYGHFGPPLLEALWNHFTGQRRLTFAMLERAALRVLVAPDGSATDAARAIAGGIAEILVDECQDVNPAQAAILDALQAAGPPKRFSVGDVKQSIYGFRQADPDIFTALLDRARAGGESGPALVPLVENFRTAPPLLAEINRLFEPLFSPAVGGIAYDELHRLVPGRAETPAGPRHLPRFEVVALPCEEPDGDGDDAPPERDDTRQLEARALAEQVARIGPPWGGIAVLLRSLVRTAPLVVEELLARGIPVRADGASGLLEAPECQELLAILRTVENPFDDVALVATLRSAAAGWSDDDLVRLRAVEADVHFIVLLERVAQQPGHRLEGAAKAFLASLAEWQSLASRRPMAELIAHLCQTLLLLERASVRPNGDRRRRNLLRLVDYARRFDTFARKGLRRFLSFLEDLTERSLDIEAPPASAATEDAVRVMSVHQSKGLEFPVVVLGFAGKRFNDSDLNEPVLGDRSGLVSFRRLWRGAREEADPVRDGLRAARLARVRGEELRLLYVALTRAQERAVIVGRLPSGPAAWNRRWARILHSGRIDDRARCQLLSPLDAVLLSCTAATGGIPESPPAEIAQDSRLLRFPASIVSSEAPSAKVPEPAPPPIADELYHARVRTVLAIGREAARPILRAKVTATEAKRAYDAQRDGALSPPWPRPGGQRRRGELPEDGPRARGRLAGTATHRFLALFDLDAVNRGRKLREEVERLRGEGLLSSEEAAALRLGDIAAFMNAPVGQDMRRATASLRRELPFTVPVHPEEVLGAGHASPEPVVLQGVADAVWAEPDGTLTVLDYKTDWCGEGGTRVPELAEGYAPQLALYRMGVERALGIPVRRTVLFFLRAGVEATVPDRTLTGADWRGILRPALLAGEPAQRLVPGGARRA